MVLFVWLFRLIANSPVLRSLALVSQLIAFACLSSTCGKILPKYGVMIPDTRIFGYTVSELHEFYEILEEEGCRSYVECANNDFFPMMPAYTLLMGTWLVLASRRLGLSDHISNLAVLVMTFDMIETYHQRQGCLRTLSDFEIQASSAALRSKWGLIGIICAIYGLAILKEIRSRLSKRKQK